MEEDKVLSGLKMLCPNGHGLNPAKKSSGEFVLSCSCTRGISLPKKGTVNADDK